VYQSRGLRSDFIIDDDSDEGNDFWQSDKVRLGLNMAYLPEDMIRKVTFLTAPKKRQMSRKSMRLSTRNSLGKSVSLLSDTPN
jgi:hypothetical protein